MNNIYKSNDIDISSKPRRRRILVIFLVLLLITSSTYSYLQQLYINKSSLSKHLPTFLQTHYSSPQCRQIRYPITFHRGYRLLPDLQFLPMSASFLLSYSPAGLVLLDITIPGSNYQLDRYPFRNSQLHYSAFHVAFKFGFFDGPQSLFYLFYFIYRL